MRYEGIVYVLGPRTKWSGKVAEEEVVARYPSYFRWAARFMARSTHKALDTTRCGYAVVKDGQELEHVEATG